MDSKGGKIRVVAILGISLLTILFLVIGLLKFMPVSANPDPIEFVCSIKESGGDYSTLFLWEDAIECDLTAAKTAGWDNKVGSDIADGTAVTWDGGSSSGTLIHMTTVAKSGSDAFLLTVSSGTLADNDVVTDGTNSFTVNGTPESAIAVAEIDGAWAGEESSPILINGWTTSATNYIKIYTTAAARHSGVWDTNKYRIVVDGTGGVHALRNVEEFVQIEGLQIKIDGSGSPGHALLISPTDTADIEISDCIIRSGVTDTSTGAGGYGIRILNGGSNSSIKIWNNIFYDFNISSPNYQIGLHCIDADYNPYIIYNNTFHNCERAIRNSSVIIALLKNNLAQSSTYSYTSQVGGLFHADSTHNIAEDVANLADMAFGVAADSGTTTSTSANKLVDSSQNFTTTVKTGMVVKDSGTSYAYVNAVDSDSQLSLNDDIMASGETYTIYTNMFGSAAFVDEAGDDFHLVYTDTVAHDMGTDLSGDTYLQFSDDLEGDSRSGSWDIGADELTPTVTSPEGGEVWVPGTEEDITWDSDGEGNVTIEYTTDDGTTWKEVVASTANDGSYTWTIPSDISGTVKIRILWPAIALGGTAAGKVSSAVDYESNDKILVLNVSSDFTAGEYLTVDSAMFGNFSAVSAEDNLELDCYGQGVANDYDDKTIEIVAAAAAPFRGSQGDGWDYNESGSFALQ